MALIFYKHAFSSMTAATNRRQDESSTTAIRSVDRHGRPCWPPASLCMAHVTPVHDIRMKLVGVFSSVLEATIALWRDGFRRVFELCVIRSGTAAVRAATTPIPPPSDLDTSRPQVCTADQVDRELFRKLKRINWQDIPVFDDDDQYDDDDDDDNDENGVCRESKPAGTSRYLPVVSLDSASSSYDGLNDRPARKPLTASHSEQPAAASESLDDQHEGGTLNEVRMVRPDLEPLKTDDIQAVSMLIFRQDPVGACQTEIDGVDEGQAGISTAYLLVPEHKQGRIRPCNWRICGRIMSSNAVDVPYLIVTGSDGGFQGFLEEDRLYCRSGPQCLCTRGWYCHLYDEAEDRRVYNTGAKLPQCTWSLHKETNPVFSGNGPMIVVTTTEGEDFYPRDEQEYLEQSSLEYLGPMGEDR